MSDTQSVRKRKGHKRHERKVTEEQKYPLPNEFATETETNFSFGSLVEQEMDTASPFLVEQEADTESSLLVEQEIGAHLTRKKTEVLLLSEEPTTLDGFEVLLSDISDIFQTVAQEFKTAETWPLMNYNSYYQVSHYFQLLEKLMNFHNMSMAQEFCDNTPQLQMIFQEMIDIMPKISCPRVLQLFTVILNHLEQKIFKS